MRIGVFHHDGSKRKFHVGWLAAGKTLEELKTHLCTRGFGNHFIAWPLDSLVLSLRKFTDFAHQYHLQVFSDGEICGHYEFTPEAHPIEHLEEKGEREAQVDFMQFLGDFVTTTQCISCLEMDLDWLKHAPEIVFDYKNPPQA